MPVTNTAPALAAPLPDQLTGAGLPFSYSVPAGSFVDVDAGSGDTLAYSATLADGSALPAWLSFDANSRSFSGTPLQTTSQPIALKVIATDQAGATASDIFTVSVLNSIVGDAQDDTLFGTVVGDAIYGLGGNDKLSGGQGDDALFGGDDNDDLDGGTGNDTVHGDAGDDSLRTGGSGILDGGDGNDRLATSGNLWNVRFVGGAGNDTIDAAIARSVEAGAGDDSVRLGTQLSQQVELIDGGAGNDTFMPVSYLSSYFTGSVNLDFSKVVNFETIVASPSSQLSLSNVNISDSGVLTIRNAYGDYPNYPYQVDGSAVTVGRLVMVGTGGGDVFRGGALDDDLQGRGGDDQLYGNAGNDTLDGGDGDDTFYGGAGDDLMHGGDDVDTAVYTGNLAGYTVTQDPATGFVTVAGQDGTDTLVGVNRIQFADQTLSFVFSLVGAPAIALPNAVEDTPYIVHAPDLLNGFVHPEGYGLTVSGLSASTGQLAINGDGSWTLTLSQDYAGSVTLNYTVVDGHGGAIPAVQQFTVDAVNDAPTGSPTANLPPGDEDMPYVVQAADLLAGFNDPDGDPLWAVRLSADHGIVADNGDGSYTITPQANYNGNVVLSYDVADGQGGSATGMQNLVLTAVNDAPLFAVRDGKVIVPVGASDDVGQSAVVQADGKIVIAGYSQDGSGVFSAMRLLGDGSLDTSFGNGGKVIVPVGAEYDVAYSTAVQPDGGIVIAGHSWNNSGYDFSAVRLLPDGSLDGSFGTDGKVIVPVGASDDVGQSAVVQADGKIVIAGYSGNGAGYDFSAIRLLADGSLDSGFGNGGKAIVPVGADNGVAFSAAAQPDGKVVIAGYTFNGSTVDFCAIRLLADGSLDGSFGNGGKAIVPVGAGYGVGLSTVVQPDGKIVVAGYSANGADYDFSAIRLLDDGSLDSSFGDGGKAIVAVGAFDDVGFSTLVQPDGKIVVAGHSWNGANNDFSAIRLLADGSLDSNFGSAGKAIVPVGTDGYGNSVVLQPDGRIVVAGYGSNGIGWDFSAIRLLADGSLDPSFGNFTPHTLDGTVAYTENAAPVLLDGAVAVYDVELAAQGHYGGASLTLVRQGGADAQDLFSASGGLGALTEGASLVYDGTAIGSVVQNSAGTLQLSFYTNATQALVNGALRGIAYANASDAPPASVTLQWSFNDGNAGAQGMGGALVATGTTTVDISNVNDAPTGAPTAVLPGGTEDTAYAVSAAVLLQGFSDVDTGDTLSVANLGADHGLVVDNGNGSFTITPQADYFGAVTLTYDVVDSSGAAIAAMQQFMLADVSDNVAPVALGDEAAVLRNGNVVVAVRGNDSDADGHALTVSQVTQGGHGSVVIDGASGNPRYTPTAGFIGTDSFGYTASDGHGGEASATVSVIVASLLGNGNANTLTGTSATDVIAGLGGDDTLSGSSGNDQLYGGDGNDSLRGGAGTDTVNGGAGNDTFLASSTELTGDTLVGGAGSDTLKFVGSVTLGAAGMTLSGIETLNMASYSLAVQGVTALDLSGLQVSNGGAINGDSAANTIIGSAQANVINGSSGDDALFGFGGNDTLRGGSGIDVVDGGADDDTFLATTSELTGDTLVGGSGYDTLRFAGSVTLGTAGVTLDGVEALDMAGYSLTVQGATTLDLSAVQVVNGGAINGDTAANTIIGSAQANVISGSSGNDILYGGAGNDTLRGGSGVDVVDAGDDDDVFLVTSTELTGDTLAGGAGNDTLKLVGNTTLGTAGVTLSGIEMLDMGFFSLLVQGTKALDLSGMTMLNAGTINGDGSANAITGSNQADVLNGGSGSDTLRGAGGADLIAGGTGNDQLYGGATVAGDGSADTFVFNAALGSSNVDTIHGFEADGLDRISLDSAVFSAVFSNGSAGLDGSEFRASAGGLAADANDFILFDTVTGSLYYDVDGSGAGARVKFAVLSGYAGAVDFSDFIPVGIGP